ncbi:MAG: hypothetical protein R3324_19985, partial [Halobacteriales archaeon]|nr:hypothetical protein [Halobacteriales archaeon]
FDYEEGMLFWHCTSCDGVFQSPGSPSGTLGYLYLPPAGLRNRTPQEFFGRAIRATATGGCRW